jgi:CRP/FNR family transcriptional regulator, anaerobic regulatory protein
MLFSGLPDEAFDHMLQPIDHFIFPPGGLLHESGRCGEFVFSIRRGLVKLINIAPGGVQRIVRLLGPGSSVGLELLDGEKGYRHSVVAVNEVDACRIPLTTVKRLQAAYPVLHNQVRERLQEQLDRADDWIVSMGTGPAKERVVSLLLMLGDICSDSNGDIEMLHLDDMAAIVGTSIETVSRIIADLKRRRLVYKVANHLYRLDTEALSAIAGNTAD